MSFDSSLYYEGYDPTWVIGSGAPPPAYYPTPARKSDRIVPSKVPRQGNVFPSVPMAEGKMKDVIIEPLGPVENLPTVPIARADPKFVSPRARGENLNPYAGAGAGPGPLPVHAAPPLQHLHRNQAFAGTTVPMVVHPRPVVVKAPGAVPPLVPGHTAAVRRGGEVVVDPVVKVVMRVPRCCDACDDVWKEGITEVPGFQGYDVEREMERVSVFGQVSPSEVLATMQKSVPRATMWRA